MGEPEEEEAIKHGLLPASARPWKDGPVHVEAGSVAPGIAGRLPYEAGSVAPGMAGRLPYEAGVAQLVEQLIRNLVLRRLPSA